jgi:hypothetical protein
MYNTMTLDVAACIGVLERPRYFPRQLITPADLNLEASYFRDRLRRHNRMLHGWGVVCGVQVCLVETADGTGAQPWKIRLTPGYLIDACGNEVAIVAERIVDLRSSSVIVVSSDPAGELSDPWCSDVPADREFGRIWVAVRYKEGMTRPMHVQPAGCGCDDTSCEYSRWCDGYEVGLLEECPSSHAGTPPSLADLLAGAASPLGNCPADPKDAWVVLAIVDVDGQGKITAIDNCSCRRMVFSFANFWWRCAVRQVTIEAIGPIPDGPYTPGQSGIVMDIKGTNLDPDAQVSLGEGVKVTVEWSDPGGGGMRIAVEISSSAAPGDRTLTIVNQDCTMAAHPKALTITSPPTVVRKSTGRSRREK